MNNSLSFQQLFAMLKANRKLGLSIFFATIAVVLVTSLVWPKRYTASATLIIDARPKDQLDGTTAAGPTGSNYLVTQTEIIKSERVARLVIDRLNLASDPETREKWESETDGNGDYVAWLADKLTDRLVVAPAKDANVIDLSFAALTPEGSMNVVNGFVQAYLDTMAEIRTEPAKIYSSFFDSRVRDARSRLETAQRALSSYQREHGITLTDERIDIETVRLNDLAAQYARMQEAASDSRERDVETQSNPDSSQASLRDAVVASLRSEIARREAELSQADERLGPNHPALLERKANIAALQARLNQQLRRVVTSTTSDRSVAAGRLAEARQLLDAQRARVQQLKADRDEALVLQRDIENAQKAYDALQTRLTQTYLESQSTQTVVSVVKSASLPGRHSSPRILLNTAAAAVFGMLLAVGLIIIRSIGDRRLLLHEDITTNVGLPLLITFPKLSFEASAQRSTPALARKFRILALPRTQR